MESGFILTTPIIATTMPLSTPNNLRRALAATQHAIWCHWMDYMFSSCLPGEDGDLIIPRRLAERWRRQMNTPFEELPDGEERSDYEHADKVLETLNNFNPLTKRTP